MKTRYTTERKMRSIVNHVLKLCGFYKDKYMMLLDIKGGLQMNCKIFEGDGEILFYCLMTIITVAIICIVWKLVG